VTPSRSGVAGGRAPVPEPGRAYEDGTRRAEVLETAASLIATSGLRTSMHDIGKAAGIQTGSL
jgi:AcrR family transcriptional regulator